MILHVCYYNCAAVYIYIYIYSSRSESVRLISVRSKCQGDQGREGQQVRKFMLSVLKTDDGQSIVTRCSSFIFGLHSTCVCFLSTHMLVT
jgi:hypothetical protein